MTRSSEVTDFQTFTKKVVDVLNAKGLLCGEHFRESAPSQMLCKCQVWGNGAHAGDSIEEESWRVSG